MRLLLDTHALLWFLRNDENLSLAAKNAILSAENQVWVSIASLWEIAIKVRLGKLMLPDSYEKVFPSQLMLDKMNCIAIEYEHLNRLSNLPLHHHDPFDRIIIAQTLAEG